MCGIALHFNSTSPVTPLDLARLHHRGPDAWAEWVSPDAHCWMGHTRLAIVDLSPAGAQPMPDPSTGNVIIFNGEIYNHQELRAELASQHPCWVGSSDTETILAAYARWGEAMVERLRGMFAFVIYDKAQGTLFAARDRLGIKPFYYVKEPGGLRVASETRLLRGEEKVSLPAVAAYLRWGACPEESILFESIQVLPAGSTLTVARDGTVRIHRYWPAQRFTIPVRRDKTPAQRVREHLERAVSEHLLGDVPIASFLSGGIDSSVITALAARQMPGRLLTFSVGFDQRDHDETPIAEEVARRYNTVHQRVELKEDEIISLVCRAVEQLDLPSVDAINTYIVASKVAEQGIKVALSGLGGDELFGGYPSFHDVPWLRWLSRMPRFSLEALAVLGPKGERLADLPGSNVMDLALWRRSFWTLPQLRQAGLQPAPLRPVSPPELPDTEAEISWAELTGYMRHLLLRDSDQMSMAVSLEMRVPFLDHLLVEYALSLPSREKRRFGPGKGLLIESCRDLLPTSVYQRPKMGFALPMQAWMKGPLARFVEAGLAEILEHQVLQESFVSHSRADFNSGRQHWSRLWGMVVLGHYLKREQRS